MRERKYVKLRVDMYEDTKFKIIDMKPERDVIYYIWSRLVLLAGKVNLEGELYLSKNIPYTIETLAIEFNRDIAQIKLTLEIFIELQMLELTEDSVYKVSNFAKHQNIKVKEKELSKNEETKVKDISLYENLKPEIIDEKNTESNDKTVDISPESSETAEGINLEVTDKNNATAVIENCIEGNIKEDKFPKDGIILLDTKKSRKKTGKKKDKIIVNNVTVEELSAEEVIEEDADGFIYGDIPLDKGERIVSEWSFKY